MVRPVDYAALTERTCSRCHVTKPVAEFHRYVDASAPTGWRYHSWCRPCANERARTYGTENRQRRNQRLRAWRQANPEAARAYDRRQRLRRQYGLSEADLDAMKVASGGRCALCERRTELVIDHDHATGNVRGLICAQCNTLLGWLERPGVRGKVDDYLS